MLSPRGDARAVRRQRNRAERPDLGDVCGLHQTPHLARRHASVSLAEKCRMICTVVVERSPAAAAARTCRFNEFIRREAHADTGLPPDDLARDRAEEAVGEREPSPPRWSAPLPAPRNTGCAGAGSRRGCAPDIVIAIGLGQPGDVVVSITKNTRLTTSATCRRRRAQLARTTARARRAAVPATTSGATAQCGGRAEQHHGSEHAADRAEREAEQRLVTVCRGRGRRTR